MKHQTREQSCIKDGNIACGLLLPLEKNKIMKKVKSKCFLGKEISSFEKNVTNKNSASERWKALTIKGQKLQCKKNSSPKVS